MTFSATTHHIDGTVIRLDLVGELNTTDIGRLRLTILDVITIDLPDELLVDLSSVTFLSTAGIQALISGYIAAINYGTWYRVVNAHHQVRHTLQATGTLDMLADSDDVGALLHAVLTNPAPNSQSRTHKG